MDESMEEKHMISAQNENSISSAEHRYAPKILILVKKKKNLEGD